MCSIATTAVVLMQVSLQAEKDQLESFKASLRMEVKVLYFSVESSSLGGK